MPHALIVDKPIELTSDERQVLLGSILGDGHLSLPPRYDNTAFVEQHSIKQKAYLEWKRTFLQVFEPKATTRITYNPLRQKFYQFYVIKTPVHPYFNHLHDLLYLKGKKVVSIEILEELSALGLAVWWCDDGCYRYRNKSGCLATDNYSYNQNLMLQEWFMKKWNVKVRVVKSSYGNYRLDINPVPFEILLNIISTFVPECMDYKIGNDEKKKLRAKILKKGRDRAYYERKRLRLNRTFPKIYAPYMRRASLVSNS